MQKTSEIMAIRKATKLLRLVESLTDLYDLELEDSVDKTEEISNPFFQLGRISSEKYGGGYYLSLLFLQHGLASMLYFRGKIDEDCYQESKVLIKHLFKELDDLTPTVENKFIQ